jgi:tetratricopeptide (TPR) repeat protein
LHKALAGNFKGLELFDAALDLGADEDAFLTRLERAQEDLAAYMAVDEVMGRLSETEGTLLDRLRTYPTAVIVDGVRAVVLDLDEEGQTLEGALERLVRLSLVDQEPDRNLGLPRYRTAPLVADRLARRHGAPERGTRETAARYLVWAFENLDDTLDAALAAHEALTAAELSEEAHRLALDYLVPWFDRRGLYRTLLEEWLPAIRQAEEPELRARALNSSGKTYLHLGDYDAALKYLEASLAIRREIGDRSGEGATLNNMGTLSHARGDYDAALKYLEASLAIQREIGDRNGEGTTLNNIATVSLARVDYDAALKYLEASRAIQREIGVRAEMSRTLFNIASAHWERGEKDQALAGWLAAYRLAKAIGYAPALQALDDLARQLGGEGLAYWEALAAQQAGDPEE